MYLSLFLQDYQYTGRAETGHTSICHNIVSDNVDPTEFHQLTEDKQFYYFRSVTT